MRVLLSLIFIGLSFSAHGLTEDQCAIVLERAHAMTTEPIYYDGSYVKIPYPDGDVPSDIGVCTDVVVRSLRTIGLDLQKLVHESMVADYAPYKGLYGSKSPDTNIDHRRVLNLRVYFSKHHSEIPVTAVAEDYKPCDLVTWNLDKGLKHIGIVSDKKTADGRPLILHHILQFPSENDVLFYWPITGHYRID